MYLITLLYQFITHIRNYLYDKGYFKTYQPNSPRLINVGNLTVGGTGKTPHVELLIRRFLPTQNLATLSRGYGRKTKGFRIASPTDTPETLGDEPYQMHQKAYSLADSRLIITVGEKRVFAVQAIEKLVPKIDLVLLDDAFQHRAIKAHFNLLLTDYNRLFYDDLPFPSGRLREGRQGAKRADAVIVSKCPPNLSIEQQASIKQQVLRYAKPKTPVFFTSLRYELPLPAGTRVSLLTGIARAKPMLQYLKTIYEIDKHFEFPDHHAYTEADIAQITTLYPILTTEKDWTKLSQPAFSACLRGRQVLTLPIEVYFLKDEAFFWELLQQHIG